MSVKRSLEENIFNEMMKLERKIIQEALRMLDRLILSYGNKEIFQLDITHIQKKIYMEISDEELSNRILEPKVVKKQKNVVN